MKHIEATHNLSLLFEALKTNKAAWDKLDLEIKTLKAVEHLCLYDHGDAFGLCVYSGFGKEAASQIISKVRAKSVKLRTAK